MEAKPHTVDLFTDVAPKYEFLNSLMTAGRDAYWRKQLLNVSGSALNRSPEAVLDLATGTGDVARMISEKWPKSKVIATDPTPAMLLIGKQKSLENTAKPSHKNIEWTEGMAEKIHLPDQSVDIVTISFGYRNVANEHKDAALREIQRVLKPGGVFAILELGLPKRKILRTIYSFLLTKVMPRFAALIAPKGPYQYLAKSILELPEPETIKNTLSKAGFIPYSPLPLTFGMSWIYMGKKKIDA
ncbi:MAG: ubiquinone/menaquinone biosynthesis methyltransferase [Oligoflexia bacterium]|nr:ubiquinone/menaquinone biosynthesis methyltransferase [Oligoflexia bacterium]